MSNYSEQVPAQFLGNNTAFVTGGSFPVPTGAKGPGLFTGNDSTEPVGGNPTPVNVETLALPPFLGNVTSYLMGSEATVSPPNSSYSPLLPLANPTSKVVPTPPLSPL
jgi:hypothetical protein